MAIPKVGNELIQSIVDGWNAAHPDQTVTIILMSPTADQQLLQMIQNMQAKSTFMDVITLDNEYFAQFAANQWLVPLPKANIPWLSQFVPSMLVRPTYRGNLYGLPYASDSGLLYYRTDLLQAAGISQPPTTWKEMESDCDKIWATQGNKNIGCYAGQFDKYEGLTCNIAEVIYSAGGLIVDASGKPVVGTPAAEAGVDFLVTAFKGGYIPKEAITYHEEDGRAAFEAGKLIFYRNWPYEYSLDAKSAIAGKYEVAGVPGLNGPGTAGLGGGAVAISTFSANKATAFEFMLYYTSIQTSERLLSEASRSPVYTALYDDPSNLATFPYLKALKGAEMGAIARPAAIRYIDVTAAIQNDAYAALTGTMTTAQAMQKMQADLVKIIGSS